MWETGSDFIFPKYKKVSTPTAQCSGGFLKGSVKLDHRQKGFHSLCNLVSEHKAGIKNSLRELKAALVFDIQNSQRIFFCSSMLPSVSAAASHSRGSRISGTLKTCSSGIKICMNYFCIIQNEC